MHCPFIFLIGGVDWDGAGDGVYSLQDWNGISREKIRSVEMQSQFLFIKSNGEFLFVCDSVAGVSEESIYIFSDPSCTKSDHFSSLTLFFTKHHIDPIISKHRDFY